MSATPILIVAGIIVVCCIFSSLGMSRFGSNIPYIQDTLTQKPESKMLFENGTISSVISCVCLLFILIVVALMQKSKAD